MVIDKITMSSLSVYVWSSDVTERQCSQAGACVLLSIMDHDVISANDFAGEVCIGLQQVLSSTASQGSSALLPLNLPILNYDAPPPTVTGNYIVFFLPLDDYFLTLFFAEPVTEQNLKLNAKVCTPLRPNFNSANWIRQNVKSPVDVV